MEQGFPNRVNIDQFLSIYNIQSPKVVHTLEQQQKIHKIEALIRSIGLSNHDFKLGSSRICFRHLKTDLLNTIIHPTNDKIMAIKTKYEKKLGLLYRWSKMKDEILARYEHATLEDTEQKCSIEITQEIDRPTIAEELPNTKKRKRKENVVSLPKSILKRVTKPKKKMDVRPSQKVRYDGKNHLPDVDGETNPTRCKNEGCPLQTKHFCIKCNVHLCIKPGKNCFIKFHTTAKKNKKK